MEMQDKEFDKLFRSNLVDMEFNPSDRVWGNIDKELKMVKGKRHFAMYLSIAASVIMLVSAGILFIPQKTKIIPKPLVKNNVVSKKQSNEIAVEKNDLNSNTHLNHRVYRVLNAPLSAKANSLARGAIINKDTIFKVETKKVKNEPQQAGLASLPQKANIIAAITTDEETASFKLKPTTITAEVPVIDQPAEPVKIKHRIRSLGDFINVMVAAVDKRKDKIIEFTNTDDEDRVTGINLGVIKIKKDK